MSHNEELIRLRNRLQGKVLILGIGNPLRGDDAAGPELIRRLSNSSLPTVKPMLLLDVGEVPENYLGKIVKERPDTIVLVDAVDLGASPGTVRVVGKDDIRAEFLSTHSASLNMVAEYIEQETSADVFVLGIQPENLGFGEEISEPVRESLEKIVKVLERV